MLRLGLLLLMLASLAMSQACYAGDLAIETDIPRCFGNETGNVVSASTFFCLSGSVVKCRLNILPSCKYVYKNATFPAIAPSATVSPRPSSASSPSASPSPLPCTNISRNLTNTYCRVAPCVREYRCDVLSRDSSGFIRNLTIDQMVRFGLVNGPFSPYNNTLDAPVNGNDIYRPRPYCEMKGNFYGKTSFVSGIGTYYNTRPFLEVSLCYPCFATEAESLIASGSSSSIPLTLNGVTTYCPQPDGTDPVGCFIGSTVDTTCLRNFNSGIKVNGDYPFCQRYGCNPYSMCNCSMVDFHEECYDENDRKLFKITQPVIHFRESPPISQFNIAQSVVEPEISFDGRFLRIESKDDFLMQIRTTKPILKISGKNELSLDLHGKIPPGKFSLLNSRSGNTFNFYLEEVESKSHRTLGIIMFSISMSIFAAIFLYFLVKYIIVCLKKTRMTPVYRKVSESMRGTLDLFTPKMSFVETKTALIFMGIGLVSASLIKVDSQILAVNSFAEELIVNDCISIYRSDFDQSKLLRYHNMDCLFQTDFYRNGTIVETAELKIDSWTNCEFRNDFAGNLEDTFKCSTSLTTVILSLLVVVLVVVLILLLPSCLKLALLISVILIPVKACDFSQVITSSSQNCVNLANSQSCSLVGTFSEQMKLEQELCLNLKNPFGTPREPISITYSKSFEVVSTRVSGYTQAFSQSYFSKDRCNDCLFSCNGDCSSEQCLLIGGFGVNPNAQNTDNSISNCPTYSGCDVIEDSVSSSWTSGCLLKPNCHWWQYISCGYGEISKLSSFFQSKIVSELTIREGNQTTIFNTEDAQPYNYKGMLISTSTQSNPVDLGSIGFDSLVLKNGTAYVCSDTDFSQSTRSSLGDFFCTEQTCTYEGPASIRIPRDLCEHQTVGGESGFSCYGSFFETLETQSSCRPLPFMSDFGLMSYDGSRVFIDLISSSTLELRVSANNASFEFTNTIVKPDLRIGKCNAYIDYYGSGNCTLVGKCNPPGLISLSLEEPYVSLLSNTIYCEKDPSFVFNTVSVDNNFHITLGNLIYNQTLEASFTADNYTATIQEEKATKTVEDEGWEPFDSWTNVLNGLGNIWDWLIIIVECVVILAVLGVVLYVCFNLFIACLPMIRSKIKSVRRSPSVLPTESPKVVESTTKADTGLVYRTNSRYPAKKR